MCEILVRVVDKINVDPYLNVKLTKRGFVIVAMPDGWAWGKEELANPAWRLFKLPNVPLAQVAPFLSPEVDTDPQHPSKMLQRRAFRLNLDDPTLPPALVSYVADATRSKGFLSSNVTGAQINAWRVANAPVPDPAVL